VVDCPVFAQPLNTPPHEESTVATSREIIETKLFTRVVTCVNHEDVSQKRVVTAIFLQNSHHNNNTMFRYSKTIRYSQTYWSSLVAAENGVRVRETGSGQ